MKYWRIVVVTIVSIVGIIATAYLMEQGGDTVNKDRSLDLLRILSLCTTAFVPLYAFIRAETRSVQSDVERLRMESIENLERLLKIAITRIFEDGDLTDIRANLMLVSHNVLTILCSVNMEFYPDNEIKLEYGQGCAGVAWKRACEEPLKQRWAPVLALTKGLSVKSLREEWSLTDDQIKKTRHVLWILSTPIFYTTSEGSKFIGILNFDGVRNRPKRMRRLKDAATHQDCADIAEALGRELVSTKSVD